MLPLDPASTIRLAEWRRRFAGRIFGLTEEAALAYGAPMSAPDGMIAAADPVLLFSRLRAAQEELGERVDRRGLNAKIEKPLVMDLQSFSTNLKTAWKDGETRSTHRRPYRRIKLWPKRPSMYEPLEARIKEWLREDPALSAAVVLQRLKAIDPARFKDKNLRMAQVLVKAWRMELAGLILIEGGWIKSSPLSAAAE